jgi:hypothetical protein
MPEDSNSPIGRREIWSLMYWQPGLETPIPVNQTDREETGSYIISA